VTRFNALPGAVRAAFWITMAGITFTGMMAIARTLTPALDTLEIVFFRAVFGVIAFSPMILWRRGAILRSGRFMVLTLRAVFAYLGLVGYFLAASLIPLADITALMLTSPVLASIAAMLLLGEAPRLRRWVAVGIGLAGAMIVVRPGFTDMNPGVLFAFLAVVMTVASMITLKFLSFTDHPDTIALYQAALMVPIALVPALLVWRPPTTDQLLWLLALGALGAVTQRALSRAYAAADVSLVTIIDFVRLPIAALIGLAVFGEWPVIWVWVGGAVIVVSSILLTRREAAVQEGRRAPIHAGPPPAGLA
jgi:drug/metabolite transporter (DMT)-like permease